MNQNRDKADSGTHMADNPGLGRQSGKSLTCAGGKQGTVSVQGDNQVLGKALTDYLRHCGQNAGMFPRTGIPQFDEFAEVEFSEDGRIEYYPGAASGSRACEADIEIRRYAPPAGRLRSEWR